MYIKNQFVIVVYVSLVASIIDLKNMILIKIISAVFVTNGVSIHSESLLKIDALIYITESRGH